MSFSPMTVLALVLAAGPIAPASAAILDLRFVRFYDETNTHVGGGSILVADPGFPGSVPVGGSFRFAIDTPAGFFDFTSAPPLFAWRDEAKTDPYLMTAQQRHPNDNGVGIALLMLSGPAVNAWTVSYWEPCGDTICPTTTISSGSYTFPEVIPPSAEPEPSVIPLPASAALLPLGLLALGALRRRKTG